MNYPIEILTASGIIQTPPEAQPDETSFHIIKPMRDKHPSESTLQNKYYIADIIYTGDFTEDTKTRSLDLTKLSANARPIGPNNRTRMRLSIFDFDNPSQDFIKFANGETLFASELTQFKRNMDIAEQSLRELRKAIKDLILKDYPDDQDQ